MAVILSKRAAFYSNCIFSSLLNHVLDICFFFLGFLLMPLTHAGSICFCFIIFYTQRPQAVMATGQVLFHRFYCKKSFARFNVKVRSDIFTYSVKFTRDGH
jgi:hypothetical protein